MQSSLKFHYTKLNMEFIDSSPFKKKSERCVRYGPVFQATVLNNYV